MKIKNPVFSAMLLGLSLLAFSADASARDHGDRHHGRHGYERHDNRHHDYYSPRRDVRVVERHYVVREAPRRYYEPVYERRAPIYREEPGVVVRIGLPFPPPIFLPFD